MSQPILVNQNLPVKSPPGSFLGIYTKSVNQKPEDLALRRIERWSMQAASRALLNDFKRLDKRQNLQNKFRAVQCLRLPTGQTVHIKSKNNTAHYQGLNACGSIWTCPICAAKISERRRLDLCEAISKAKDLGLACFMVTATVPHSKNMRFQKIADAFQKARTKWRNSRSWKNYAIQLGLVGTIRALEVTVGQNGWHLHTHELFFVPASLDLSPRGMEEIKYVLHRQWSRAALSVGFASPSYEHGLDVQDGSVAANYVGKWGMDQELTKGHQKSSKNGFSPWDLLRLFRDTGDLSYEDKSSLAGPEFSPGCYFQEFAYVMHGKRQLVWSPGLKDLLRVEVLSDDDLANEYDEDDSHIGSLTLLQWRIILRADHRGQVLEVANIGGMPAVFEYIDKILKRGDYRKDKSIPF